MESTKVLCEFRIIGEDFPVDNVTEVLNIKPTETYCIGEKMTYTSKKYNHTEWMYSTGYIETLDIDCQLKKIINIFELKSEKLIQIRQKYSLDICIEIVILIENNEPPAIYFDDEVIKFASKIGAVIDVDTYIN